MRYEDSKTAQNERTSLHEFVEDVARIANLVCTGRGCVPRPSEWTGVDALVRRKGLVQPSFSRWAEEFGRHAGPREANVKLLPSKRFSEEGKEGGQGLWFAARMRGVEVAWAGVETDFLALYALALGSSR
jgi:hypothetical protein